MSVDFWFTAFTVHSTDKKDSWEEEGWRKAHPFYTLFHHTFVFVFVFLPGLDKSASLLTHSLTHVFSHRVLPTASFPSGERHRLPSRPRHSGHRGLGRPLQLLGQRRPHQAEDLGAAGPANHCLLLQPQRQHLCLRLQLRLVKGRGQPARVDLKCVWQSLNFLFFFSLLFRATSTTTPRKRTTSSWGWPPRSWSRATRNGESRAAADHFT